VTGLLNRCGRLKLKTVPCSGSACHPDRAAVRFHESMRDRQPQPGAPVAIDRLRARFFSPVEAVEQVRQVVRRDGGAGVMHVYLQAVPGLPDAQRDRARRGACSAGRYPADCAARAESCPGRARIALAGPARSSCSQRDVVLGGAGRHGADGRFGQLGQRGRFALHSPTARRPAWPGQTDRLIRRSRWLQFGQRGVEVAGDGGGIGDHVIGHRFQHHADGGQRRAQIVGDPGDQQLARLLHEALLGLHLLQAVGHRVEGRRQAARVHPCR
jgi:hypothetical protein